MESGVTQGHEVTELSDMECDPLPSGFDGGIDDAPVGDTPTTRSTHDDDGSVNDAVNADCHLLPVAAEVEAACIACEHVCAESTTGCAECHHTCHDDCSSNLCAQNPFMCKLCFESYAVPIATRIDSLICNTAQQQMGCHACGREGCWRANLYCTKHQRNVIPLHEARPCGLYNVGSSCYINSTIQAIFAISSLNTELRCLWENLSIEIRERLLSPTGFKTTQDVPVEEALAALFWQSHTTVADTPVSPDRILHQFYKNEQDSSGGFVMGLLNGGLPQFCPRLNRRFEFQINRWKVCSCGYREPSLGEYKMSLELSSLDAEGQAMFIVQQTLNHHMDTLDQVLTYTYTCASCQMEQAQFKRIHEISIFPEVRAG